jgi:DNA-binding transcriptional ArsR family regulator
MNIDSVFAALSDPTRRELLARLARRPSRAGDLAVGLPMSRPAVSKHMSVLRRARLIESRRNGREQIYRLRPQGRAAIEELQRTLERVSSFWDTALESFKNFAESR